MVTSGAGDVLLSGIAALRQQYGEWFSQMQDLSAEVVQRLTRGAWVVDDEYATAKSVEFSMRALVAYRVRNGVIDRVILMSPAPEDDPTV